MTSCPSCRVAGRRSRIETREEGRVAVIICANPRCANYKKEIGEEKLPEEYPMENQTVTQKG